MIDDIYSLDTKTCGVVEPVRKLKILRLQQIACGILSCLVCIQAIGLESRPASIAEIQALFDLAIFGPQRLWVEADISSSETPWSPEQIAAEVKLQSEMMNDLQHGSTMALQQARSNAIARSHSGTRVLHVQEWYSGNHYRLDQTDEGMVSPEYLRDNPGKYRNTYVNVDDPAVSPYSSFFVDHELRDAQLSKVTLYGQNGLWRVLGLDEEIILPVLLALLDPNSGPKGRRATDADLSSLKMDATKAARICNGTDKNWRLLAVTGAEENADTTRFILSGKVPTPSPDAPNASQNVEIAYRLGRAGSRTVCMEVMLTNYTVHNSFASKREAIDGRGVPRVWKRVTVMPGLPTKQVDVVIKQIELSPTFKDLEVFSPVFPTNYIVSDVTSGQAAIMQNPLGPKTMRKQPLSFSKRTIVVSVLVLTALGAGIVLLRLKLSKTEV